MMMSYGLPNPGYGQSYEQAELFRRLASKGEIWSYPQDHIFFRSRIGAMPKYPKTLTPQHALDSTGNIFPRSSSPSNGTISHNGHVGALEKITQMPVDILYEVGRFSLDFTYSKTWEFFEEGPVQMCSCASEFCLRDLSLLDIFPSSPSGCAQPFENNAQFTEISP